MNHYYLTGLLFFSQLSLTTSAQAQMYQWVDPESGTTQLSGKPPVWYRSVEGGPRVFVFNRGQVVDDTGIDISDEQRISLRTKAFVNAEKDRLAAKEKAMEAAKLKAAMDRNVDEQPGSTADVSEIEDDVLARGVADVEDTEINRQDDGEEEISVEKMKALIAEWENKRTEDARKLLQQEP